MFYYVPVSFFAREKKVDGYEISESAAESSYISTSASSILIGVVCNTYAVLLLLQYTDRLLYTEYTYRVHIERV